MSILHDLKLKLEAYFIKNMLFPEYGSQTYLKQLFCKEYTFSGIWISNICIVQTMGLFIGGNLLIVQVLKIIAHSDFIS